MLRRPCPPPSVGSARPPSLRGVAIAIWSCLVVTLCWGTCSCGASTPPADAAPTSYPQEPFNFRYGGLDGQVLGSKTFRGAPVALLFVTTFDMASQVTAKRLNEAIEASRHDFSAVAVVLEPPHSAVLAKAFADALELTYPVAMADPDTLAGTGRLGELSVPTLMLLDARSAPVWKQSGIFSMEDLLRELDAAVARGSWQKQ